MVVDNRVSLGNAGASSAWGGPLMGDGPCGAATRLMEIPELSHLGQGDGSCGRKLEYTESAEVPRRHRGMRSVCQRGGVSGWRADRWHEGVATVGVEPERVTVQQG